MLVRACRQRLPARDVTTLLGRASGVKSQYQLSEGHQQRTYSTRPSHPPSPSLSPSDKSNVSTSTSKPHTQSNPDHDARLTSSTTTATHLVDTTTPTVPFSSPPTQSPPNPPRLRPPSPLPSQLHHSLTTFLSHSRRTNLNKTSTTYLGTRYEYLVLNHLVSHFAFSLSRIGGRGDSGIDLLGVWNLFPAISTSSTPSETQHGAKIPIPVIIQCKRLRSTSRSSPNLIRELQGSFRSAPDPWRSPTDHDCSTAATLGVVVCTRPATKGVREAMARSGRGLMWVCIEEVSESEDPPNNDGDDDDKPTRIPTPHLRTRQILWNAAAASRCGLQGVDVGTRYVDDSRGDGEESVKEAILLWRGIPIEFSASRASRSSS